MPEILAKIGDYVTTTVETFEVQYDPSGNRLFTKVGIRQGILTGEVFNRNDDEYPDMNFPPYFAVEGRMGTYAVPNTNDLVVIDESNMGSEDRYRLNKIRDESSHYKHFMLLAEAFKDGYAAGHADGYVNGANNAIVSRDALIIDASATWELNIRDFSRRYFEMFT